MTSRVARVRPPHNPHVNPTASVRVVGGREMRLPESRQLNLPVQIRDPHAEASQPQMDYMASLVSQLSQVDQLKSDEADRWIQGEYQSGRMTKRLASLTIDRLKLRIKEAKERGTPIPEVDAQVSTPPYAYEPFTDVPDGYYAVVADAGHLAFYRVSTWKDSGRRSVQVQASDSWFRMKGRAAADGVLAKIREVTPKVAGKAYADQIGCCMVCNRTLTDEQSRTRGIGPICYGRVGSAFGIE